MTSQRVLRLVSVASALAVVPALVLGCARRRDDELAVFEGGFDPTRYDGGVLPDVDPAVLGRPLRLSVPPFYRDDSPGDLAAALERYLEKTAGLDIELRVAPTNYVDTPDLLARGEIDVADLAPYQYATLVQQGAAVTPLVAVVAHGASTYGSYLVVRTGSPIKSLDDMKGKRFGFVDPLSSSGYILPAAWLRERGFDLERDVTVTFLGSHLAVVQAVRDGTVDVAAVSSDLLVGNAGLAGPLVVVAKAGRMPYDVIVARPGLDPAVAARMRDALLRLSLHDEDGHEALRAFSSADGFMPVPRGHYKQLLELARKNLGVPPPRSTSSREPAEPRPASEGIAP